MIREIVLEKKEKGKMSDDAAELFRDDPVKAANGSIVLEIMNNCLDTIYDYTHYHYPKVFRPSLFLCDLPVCNAFSSGRDREIIVCWGLIEQAAALIEKRYTEEVLVRYECLNGMPAKRVQAGVRVYLWRFIALHELYHLWHGHSKWMGKYYFDDKGVIVERTFLQEERCFSEYSNAKKAGRVPSISPGTRQEILTKQALEFDADNSAVSMLINLLMLDMENRRISKEEQKEEHEEEQKEYVSREIALIMGALATAFCLFDGNAGAKFDRLDTIESEDHPIPAIRMLQAEEIADGCLERFFPDFDERMKMESDWRKIVCDVESDHEGEVDMGQVFYYPAYTEKAQRHICSLKHRITEMQDTLQAFIVSNNADRLEEADMEFLPESVLFDENGNSLSGWTNPATGKQTAIRAKSKPIIKGPKTGRNDPCPCGSGRKYKHCCGRNK